MSVEIVVSRMCLKSVFYIWFRKENDPSESSRTVFLYNFTHYHAKQVIFLSNSTDLMNFLMLN